VTGTLGDRQQAAENLLEDATRGPETEGVEIEPCPVVIVHAREADEEQVS
jgi:hypothetical protein